MIADLKPCPFCGGDARLSYGDDDGEMYVVSMCESCGMQSMKQYYVSESKESVTGAEERALHLWNRRLG